MVVRGYVSCVDDQAAESLCGRQDRSYTYYARQRHRSVLERQPERAEQDCAHDACDWAAIGAAAPGLRAQSQNRSA
jgi:hypothetical protein